jgi:hypothetical protein
MRVGSLFLAVLVFASLHMGCATTPSLDDNSKAATGGDGKPLVDPEPTPAALGTRMISIDASAHDSAPPISVVLVIDNSNSMLDKQQNLAAGISTLLQNFEAKPLDLSLSVYTTTADYQSDATMKSSALYSTQKVVVDAGDAEVPGTNPDGSYILRSRWNLAAPYSHFQIQANDSASDVRTVSADLTSAIRNIGINGSSIESDFCTIGRVLAEPSTGPNYLFQSGSRAAFLFISDSNDASAQLPCLSERRQPMAPPTPTSSPQPQLVTVASRSKAREINYSKPYTDTTRLVFSAAYQVQNKCVQDRITRDCVTTSRPNFDPTLSGNPPASTTSIPCPQSLVDYLATVVEKGKIILPGKDPAEPARRPC